MPTSTKTKQAATIEELPITEGTDWAAIALGNGMELLFEDNRRRRYLEWTIAHTTSLSPTMRLVLRIILLHEDGYGLRACTANYDTLAREASLSKSQFRATLRRLAQHPFGHVYRQGKPGSRETRVTMEYNKAAVRELRGMWTSPAADMKKYLRRRLSPKEAAVFKAQHLEIDLEGEPECATDEEFSAWCDETFNEGGMLKGTELRFFWIRELVADKTLRAREKAVALGVELLMNKIGRPFRWTTVSTVASLSGYADAQGVRRALLGMERAGWFKIIRSNAYGLLISLRYPAHVEELVRVREEIREARYSNG